MQSSTPGSDEAANCWVGDGSPRAVQGVYTLLLSTCGITSVKAVETLFTAHPGHFDVRLCHTAKPKHVKGNRLCPRERRQESPVERHRPPRSYTYVRVQGTLSGFLTSFPCFDIGGKLSFLQRLAGVHLETLLESSVQIRVGTRWLRLWTFGLDVEITVTRDMGSLHLQGSNWCHDPHKLCGRGCGLTCLFVLFRLEHESLWSPWATQRSRVTRVLREGGLRFPVD